MAAARWERPSAPPALGMDEAHIWRARLALSPHSMSEMQELLSPDERERASRFVFAGDRERYVCARTRLRLLLGSYLGAPPAELRFTYSALGKPALETLAEGRRLCFNLAHSGELALFALTWERAIGVDVEQVRDTLPFLALLESVFAPRERALLLALPEEERRRAFFTGWARKEAYLKARGDGLSYPLDAFEVSLLPDEPPELRLPASEDAPARWRLHAINIGAEYAAAAVTEGPATLRLFDM